MEVVAVAIGLLAGFRIGFSAPWEEWWSGEASIYDQPRSSQPTANKTAPGSREPQPQQNRVMTVMLVGDSRIGKTLFCSRLASETNDQPAARREGTVEPETLSPTWRHVELASVRLDEPQPVEMRLRVEILDTPGRHELSGLLTPFYRQCGALVLMFDVASSASYASLQGFWLTHARAQRLNRRAHPPGSTIVLAHSSDERRERQVTRRDASSWCAAVGLTYFETHPKDTSSWRRMLTHLARECLLPV